MSGIISKHRRNLIIGISIIERAGLEEEYEKAMKKKGRGPWVPGWGIDVWDKT
jgi:hypothetical protein